MMPWWAVCLLVTFGGRRFPGAAETAAVCLRGPGFACVSGWLALFRAIAQQKRGTCARVQPARRAVFRSACDSSSERSVKEISMRTNECAPRTLLAARA